MVPKWRNFNRILRCIKDPKPIETHKIFKQCEIIQSVLHNYQMAGTLKNRQIRIPGLLNQQSQLISKIIQA